MKCLKSTQQRATIPSLSTRSRPIAPAVRSYSAIPATAFSRRTALQFSASRSTRLTARASDSGINYSADDLNSDHTFNTVGYKVLSVALVATGLALLTSPVRSLEYAYAATPTPLLEGLARILGSVHILAAIAANTLSDAASHARLSSDTYKRLNLGLSVWGAASLAAFVTAPVAAATATVKYAYAGLLAVAAVLPIVFSKGLLAPLPPPPRGSEVLSIQTVYNIARTAAVIFVGSILYSVYSPGTLKVTWLGAPLGALGQTLLRLLGSGAVLAWFTFVTLEDAARRGRLGASTFKALNYGTAILSGTVLAMVEIWSKAKVINLAPVALSTVNDLVSKWLDVFSQYSLVVTILLAVFSVYAALLVKKK